uniref:Uncharacterized protein n=1 Tax=Rhizophora mucronata TaxID=61149 RepID=A0A2P2NAE9_RHIMU
MQPPVPTASALSSPSVDCHRGRLWCWSCPWEMVSHNQMPSMKTT